MGLFDSKAKRIAQHQELLRWRKTLSGTARRGVQDARGRSRTNVEGPRCGAAGVRYWLQTYVESLVTWVYDGDDGDSGTEVSRGLGRKRHAAPTVLAGIPESLRPRMVGPRLHAFAGLPKDQI